MTIHDLTLAINCNTRTHVPGVSFGRYKGKSTHHRIEDNGSGVLLVNKKQYGTTPSTTLGALVATLSKKCKGWPVVLIAIAPVEENEAEAEKEGGGGATSQASAGSTADASESDYGDTAAVTAAAGGVAQFTEASFLAAEANPDPDSALPAPEPTAKPVVEPVAIVGTVAEVAELPSDAKAELKAMFESGGGNTEAKLTPPTRVALRRLLNLGAASIQTAVEDAGLM